MKYLKGTDWIRHNCSLKTIYVDDATSKTDARKKVKEEIFGTTNYYDMSGDEELGQFWDKAKIISVEGGK